MLRKERERERERERGGENRARLGWCKRKGGDETERREWLAQRQPERQVGILCKCSLGNKCADLET